MLRPHGWTPWGCVCYADELCVCYADDARFTRCQRSRAQAVSLANSPLLPPPSRLHTDVATRDHVAGDFYLRTASNQNQHRFNVAKIAVGPTVKVADLATLMPASQYAKDMSF